MAMSADIFQSTLPIQGETMLFSGSSELMLNFNPLSLYRERPRMEEKRKAEETFQSTLPIQGETCMGSGGKTIILHFNPLSLYRERRHLIRHHKHSYSISIHSPYTGRDGTSAYTAICLSVISIHSPYTGRDCSCCMCVRLCGHFNPLSLYRERPPPILLF